jgi:two-component system chemotaxis sensor kinase CheA
MEIVSAQAGSDSGKFPILDLLGNVRDEAERMESFEAIRSCAASAWEKMVTILESGKPFTSDEITWLNEQLIQFQSLLKNSGAAPSPVATAAPVVAAPQPPPASPDIPATPGEEIPLVVNVESDGELLREFLTESREHLDNIEHGILVLEERPDDAEILNTVFRAFHTFKGGAGFLNLTPINRLAHVLESLLDEARQGRLAIDRPIIELILRGGDTLKQFVDVIDDQLSGRKPVFPVVIPTEALKAQVSAAIDGTPATSGEHPPFQAAVETTAAAASQPAVPGNAPAAAASSANAAVKVDTVKLDALVDLVGEMVIAQSLVTQDILQFSENNPRFARNMAQLGRITRELQRTSMSLRMVPVRGVFQKMARIVRDLGARQRKKVHFATTGEDIELDRGVVEELSDPLMHMVRNSMDHGIEHEEKRLSRGKTAAGTLQLRAYHQGGNIIVEVEDDGAGLPRERILAKAIERGLVSPDASLTDEEVFDFIFAPGFSTADQVTDISGRGVGLDVVRRNIEKMRGRVDISSTPGKGTLFKITLPLTLAIIDGLIVKVGEERYIIPTLSVRESFHPKPGMITTVHGRAEVVNVRGRLIPLLRLYAHFGIRPASTEPGDGIVMVVQSGPNVRCLLVDGLLSKQEVVIKSLDGLMGQKHPALAGAAILGDGRVGLILDVNALVHLQSTSHLKAA